MSTFRIMHWVLPLNAINYQHPLCCFSSVGNAEQYCLEKGEFTVRTEIKPNFVPHLAIVKDDNSYNEEKIYFVRPTDNTPHSS